MKKTGVFYQWIVVWTGIVLLLQPSLSYARGDDEHGHGHRPQSFRRDDDRSRFGVHIDLVSREYVPVRVGAARYYYYEGQYYLPASGDYVLVTPPVGAVVAAIPPYYQPVIINGVTYFTSGGVYYVYTGYGYQVVPPPQITVVQAAPVVVENEWAEPTTKAHDGALLGGILGALTGGIIGHQMKGHHELGGALIGAAVGATTGGVIGKQVPNRNVQTNVTALPVETSPTPAGFVTPAPNITAPKQADESFALNIPKAQGGYTTVVIKRSGSGFVGPQGEYYPEFPKVAHLMTMYGN